MKRQPINLRLPPALVARVDVEAERLGQTRTKFVERALESALADGAQGEPATVSVGAHETGPAPVRASVPLGRCPSCGLGGPVGGTCPTHRALRFKA